MVRLSVGYRCVAERTIQRELRTRRQRNHRLDCDKPGTEQWTLVMVDWADIFGQQSGSFGTMHNCRMAG